MDRHGCRVVRGCAFSWRDDEDDGENRGDGGEIGGGCAATATREVRYNTNNYYITQTHALLKKGYIIDVNSEVVQSKILCPY